MERLICTETCLATCDVWQSLREAGVDLTQANEIADDACQAAALPYAVCGNGAPVPAQKGSEAPWLRCDMPYAVTVGVRTVGLAVQRGLMQAPELVSTQPEV